MSYKETIFLPKTTFPMKGNLPQNEPKRVESWNKQKLYASIREQSKGKKPYILHWGPPYANGHLHVGHAYNGILKDVVVKSHQLLGYDAPLVPGWDCHGLPIEWKVEEYYRKKGKNKEQVPTDQFRKECREYAEKWVNIQKEEFARLGICADFENPYVTMDFESEAAITGELLKLLNSKTLYRGFRPIMWSVVEKTALAEAEVEYQDHTSQSIYVCFPVQKTENKALENAHVVIWTTTPWSLPGNRAVAYGSEIEYSVIEIQTTTEQSACEQGQKLILANALLKDVLKQIGVEEYKTIAELKGADFAGTICAHPLANKGYDFDVPMLPGDHVTTDSGTGLVHTAPGHGPEDFELGGKYGLEVPETIDEGGKFFDHVPLFAGIHVYKSDQPVLEALQGEKRLLAHSKLKHSYPHSWRSKAPLIYRATPQWFIELDKTGLRDKAVKDIDTVEWFPKQSKNRIKGMVEGRPDWCISRQRAWGVPLTLFVHKSSRETLVDDQVNARILEAVTQEGCDAWFTSDASRFLGDQYDAEDYEKITDILDVWFESGSTQGFVLENRDDLQRPADLYLEGSDQHRGWFQSSLLVGGATRGNAPFKQVLTHGFTVDEQGRKMSKSLGNTVVPQDIIKEFGADVLRLWVVSCDYTDDLRIGKDILKHQQDIYRRFRNTLRYLLGALSDYSEEECVDYDQLPDLEKWVLHRLNELHHDFEKAVSQYSFQEFYSALHNFCSVDLSAFYFDIRKDVLYCDDVASHSRRATRMVMKTIFEQLVHMISPVLSFTADEAWQAYLGDNYTDSIHQSLLLPKQDGWNNPEVAETITTLRLQRKVMTGALEKARADGMVRSSLQAHITVYDPQNKLLRNVEVDENAIVSTYDIKNEAIPESAFTIPDYEEIGVVVSLASGQKCNRCWKVLPEVGRHEHDDLCTRCHTVVSKAS